jgi:ABC-type antimicrobial peptide transport system permease subunit
MRGLSSLALRNLWSRKLRTLVTGFGIVLGVATVLAFGVTNATVENSLNDFFSQTAGDADLTISSSDQGQTFRERALHQTIGFPTEYPRSIRRRMKSDVVLAVGSLWKEGDVRVSAEYPKGDEDEHITLVGIDPKADPQVRSYKLAAGRLVDDSDRTYTIVLVTTFAEDNDIQLGDDLEIDLGEDRVEKFEVVGLLKSEGVARLGSGAIGFLRLDVAQDLFDEGGRLSQIDVVVSPEIATNGDELDRFKESLAVYMGDDYTVSYPSAVGQAIVDSMAALRAAMGIFSTIALFVGAMLIYNTFTMTIAERTAEIGMLRAIGATRRQILRLVLVEAVLMALFGSVPGLGLGIFLAIPLVQMFTQGFGGIPLDRFTVPPASVIQAVMVGTVVTFFAALIPAWQAGRISPVEAMRTRAESRRGFIAHHGWKIGLVLMAFSLHSVILNILSSPVLWLVPSLENGDLAAFRAGLSAALLLVGLFTMAPRFWTTVLRLVGRRWAGLEHRAARWSELDKKNHPIPPSIPPFKGGKQGPPPSKGGVRGGLVGHFIFSMSWARNRYFYFFAEGGWVIGLVLVTQGLARLTRVWDYLPDASFFILMFTGGTLVVPVTIQLLERAARHVLSLLYGSPGGLGSRNLNRARGRTSLTVGVLMVGATMTIAIGSIQTAFDSTLNIWVDNTIGGDLTVTPHRRQSREFANQLMTIPGVELATPLDVISVQMTGITNSDGFSPEDSALGFQAVDLSTYRQVAGFQFAEDAEREDEILARLAQGDAVLVSSVLRDKYNVHRGDSVRLRTRRGEHDFEVAGVTNNFMWGGNSVVGIWSDEERYMGIDWAWLFLVKLSPGADVETVREAIETRLARYGDFEVESAVEFRETLSRDVRSFMAIFNVVVYIAVLVAGLGVVNTMTMNILERVREIGMLRAVGMTRGQVGRMVLAEAAAMGAIGGAFGLGIGWLIAEDMVVEMSSGSGWQFDYIFPAAAFVSAAITALIVSQLAALYPVWRAGRMRVIEAIQHE